jgi:glutamine cyclotransferase
MLKHTFIVLVSIILFTLSAAALAQTVSEPTQEATPEVTPEVTTEFTIPDGAISYYVPTILNVYPHNTNDFTQGLVWNDGELFQSTGQHGESRLQQLDLETRVVVQQVRLGDEFFGEGLALVDNRLIQLTWHENTAFIYDADTFEQIGTYTYEGEGWGLCYDGDVLWMSDGSPNLFMRDAETFELLETIPVTYFAAPVANINELECVGDAVYANVWNTDYIVEIEKDSGVITGLIDASSLLTEEQRAAIPSNGVLNGIAYMPESGTFLLTGKLWPSMFEVTFTLEGYLQPQSASGG